MTDLNRGLRNNCFAVDLNKINFKFYCQTFAAFINEKYKGEQALHRYKALRQTFKKAIEQNGLVQIGNKSDIDFAMQHNKIGAVFSVENASMLLGDLSNIDMLHEDKVKFVTLTWNGDNDLGSGIAGSGGDLTEFGKKAVKKLCKLGIYPDVSHLNERGFYSVAQISDLPLVATHSNLRRVKNHIRNLTDEQFKLIVQSGGIAGINFYKGFLCPDTFDSIYRNISCMLDMGGENSIAIGSDFDGAEINNELKTVDKVADLCDYLIGKNISQSVLQKIFYKNALRIIGEN